MLLMKCTVWLKRNIVTASLLLGLIVCFAQPASAAMGGISSFSAIADGNTDLAGNGTTIGADGLMDAGFSVLIRGSGVITRVSLKNLTSGKTWDTATGSGNPILIVKNDKEETLNSGNRMTLYAFILGAQMKLWINDRDTVLAKKGTYEITVYFVDKSTVTSKITLNALTPSVSQKPAAIVAAQFNGQKNIQLVGLQNLVGKIKNDDTFNQLTVARLRGEGNITGFKLQNTAGPQGVWETEIAGSDNPLIIVLSGGSTTVLNRPNGSINIPISGEAIFHLLVASNDMITNSQAQTRLYVYMDGNRSVEKAVTRPEIETEPQPIPTESGFKFNSLEYRGRGAYDFVGEGPTMGSNLNRDSFLAASVLARGTVTGIKVTGSWDSGQGRQTVTWDTIPTNNNPALGVTRADGTLLNKPNGSIQAQLNGAESLLLWFDIDGEIGKNPKFHMTLVFSDGKVLEGGTVSTKL